MLKSILFVQPGPQTGQVSNTNICYILRMYVHTYLPLTSPKYRYAPSEIHVLHVLNKGKLYIYICTEKFPVQDQ